MTYNIQIWKENKEKYQDYWENKDIGGTFNNLINNFNEVETYIEEEGFLEDFKRACLCLEKLGKKISGVGADFAAGSMWLTAFILKNYPLITQFYAIDYSRKNVFDLGSKLLEHYKISPEKLTLCLGSFYDIKLPSESLDFIVMAQAFHHAENPDVLLQESYRLLKKGGFLIMVGELFISKNLYFKCYLNYLASLIVSSKYFPLSFFKHFKKLQNIGSKRLKGSFQNIYFPPDPVTGDHYYLKSQYKMFFLRNKFKFINIKSKKSNHLAYILFKR
ncbi:MAG: methyltransferase domain-containing protein [Proteobacteria bacterium]|nr:methyltransferase domain-containing protein [Pseudomonadota bacterium]